MSVETYEPRQFDRVDSWALMLRDVGHLAEVIAPTELVPSYLRGNPPAIAAVILFGREIGLPPMTALGTLYITGGRVRMYAEPMAALALAAGHEIEYRESTSTRCIVAGRRRGAQTWHEVTWTIEQAKSAGLGRSDPWTKYPRRMLKARAISELCRDLFPDVLSGVESVEEGDDETYAAERNGRSTRVSRRTSGAVSDAVAPATVEPPPIPPRETAEPVVSAPDPAADDAAPPPSEPVTPPAGDAGGGAVRARPVIEDVPLPGDDTPPQDPGNAPYTAPQRALMHRQFSQLGISERQERIDVTGAVIGHPVQSANDLTVRDAARLIDTLAAVLSTENPREVLDGILRTEGYVVNDPMPFDDPDA